MRNALTRYLGAIKVNFFPNFAISVHQELDRGVRTEQVNIREARKHHPSSDEMPRARGFFLRAIKIMTRARTDQVGIWRGEGSQSLFQQHERFIFSAPRMMVRGSVCQHTYSAAVAATFVCRAESFYIFETGRRVSPLQKQTALCVRRTVRTHTCNVQRIGQTMSPCSAAAATLRDCGMHKSASAQKCSGLFVFGPSSDDDGPF